MLMLLRRRTAVPVLRGWLVGRLRCGGLDRAARSPATRAGKTAVRAQGMGRSNGGPGAAMSLTHNGTASWLVQVSSFVGMQAMLHVML
jgi:hypothetical protein